MKIYKVYESDNYGRPMYTLGYIKASSTEEARKEMSLKLYGTEDSEIVTTGFYGDNQIKFKEIVLNETARAELAKFDRNLI